ncbi:MAG: hypothetical protein IPG54_13685 [Sphingomonadales bacterium]|nr:hypothetical protein [Sphingomonadales bacterium]
MSMSFGGIGKLVSLALLGAISVPVAGVAAAPMIAVTSSVVLSSEAMVERVETGADGQERVVLKQPKTSLSVPGDR